jgi:hypothetical protein
MSIGESLVLYVFFYSFRSVQVTQILHSPQRATWGHPGKRAHFSQNAILDPLFRAYDDSLVAEPWSDEANPAPG